MLGTLFMGFKGLFEGPIVGSMFIFYHLYPVISFYESIFAGTVLGYCVASWLSFICCGIAGGTSGFAVRVSYAMLTLLFVLYFWLIQRRFPKSTLTKIREEIFSEIWLNCLLLLCGLYFFQVFYIHSLYEDANKGIWSGGSMWSDLSFHLNIIDSYLYGQNRNFELFSKPVSVIFSGHGLSYPLIPDFHITSLIVSGATSTRTAILYPSVFILLSFSGLLFCFIRRFLGRSWNGVSFLSVLVFYTLGGIGGFTVLRDREWTWDAAVNHDCTQFTSSDDEIYWFHTFCHILLPQRTATYAFPLLLFVTLAIYIGVNETISRSHRNALFLISGIITGLLPLIHAHSFATLAIIFLPYSLLHPKRSFSLDSNSGLFIHWLQFGIPILLESIPQLGIYMDRLGAETKSSESFLKYAPLWRNGSWRRFKGDSTMEDLFNFLLLWGRGTGLFVLLSLIGFIFLNNRQRKLYFCFWLIWIIGNVIQFQPWDKDNTKLFIVWTMICAGVCCMVIYRIWRIPLFLFKIFAVLIVISLILTGTIMLYRESTLWWQVMDKDDQEFGDWVAVNTDPDGIFIVNDSHIHPVTNLAGRTAMVNMAGWVQSHGYPNMWDRYRDMRSILSHPESNVHLFNSYNVSYIVYDWRLAKENQINLDFFQSTSDVNIIFHSSKYTVYDVRKFR